MSIRYFDRLPLKRDEAIPIVGEAALRILRKHGQRVEDARGQMHVAQVDGYTIRYYRLQSAACPMLEESQPADGKALTHKSMNYLDVEAGELLFGFAWDHESFSARRIVRGPWEYGILNAAGMEAQFLGKCALPPCAPESRSSTKWPLDALRQARRRRISAPIIFSVLGYSRCIHALLPQGACFNEAVSAVADAYKESREQDGYDVAADRTTSCFGLWAWKGDLSLQPGKRMTKPDFAYWISPSGGLKAAAALLLLLDRDGAKRRVTSRGGRDTTAASGRNPTLGTHRQGPLRVEGV
ncbi:hypothetical protein PQI07_31125 [Methylobacterium sp. 092160098-2]|uniref:hypothetical protein n=1 Tax=Methylobacterium sp. 092160098-2 TaxID=3025129 RepID=UPI002381AFE2|nr:hypothetical protein [Methylobacterium sp. 092160098-2]MDE4915092.1 hypothetical protein [Methylobacterium sp. 092160098-2]